MTDVLFGLVGEGFVLLVSDTSRNQSIVVQRTQVDKIVQLDSHKLMATSGSPGDADNFSEFVKANLKLYELRNNAKLTTHAAAHYTRGELATALRKVRHQRCAVSRGARRRGAGRGPSRQSNPRLTSRLALQAPYQCNLLIAGWDAGAGPSLYYLDYMACLHKMSVASHGYGTCPSARRSAPARSLAPRPASPCHLTPRACRRLICAQPV